MPTSKNSHTSNGDNFMSFKENKSYDDQLKLFVKNRNKKSTSFNNLHKNHQHQQHFQKQHNFINKAMNDLYSDLSSNLSSNNLTCSDLDTTNNNNNSSNKNGYGIYDVKLQRKKLIKCILREDLDLLKGLINKQDLTKIRDKHRNTLLHIACGFGRLKSVQFLLSVCPTLLYENDDKGHNPIDVAIKHGQIDIIKWLINSNIISDFEKICSNGQRSILHLAAKHGENEILKLICYEIHKRQLSLDVQDASGNTAAHLAAKYNHLDCLQTLVEYNCDITSSNKYGHTPCFVAEFNKNHECVHYLMIVETCINLSIKVVKLSRKLRETKANNDILKAQMDEAIAINNDFINQRENTLFITLELMHKQIQDIENKIFYEIDRLNKENSYLKQEIEQLKTSKRRIIDDNRQIRIDEQDISNSSERITHIIDNLNSTKNELLNTRDNCNNILNMDYKKMENVRSKFNQIKNYIEMNETQNAMNANNDDEIIETKEHLDILRKMYQEATHKLLIFRNLIKEREKQNNQSTNQKIYEMSNNNFIKLTNSEMQLYSAPNVPDISKHHAKIIFADNSNHDYQNNIYNENNSNNNVDSENSGNNSDENTLNTIIENYNYNKMHNLNNNDSTNNLQNDNQVIDNNSNTNNNDGNTNDDFYIYSNENYPGYIISANAEANFRHEENEDNTEFDILCSDLHNCNQVNHNNCNCKFEENHLYDTVNNSESNLDENDNTMVSNINDDLYIKRDYYRIQNENTET